MIKVLALDIAKTRSGWACGDTTNQPRWGIFETQSWDTNEGKDLGRFRELLDSFSGLTHIAMERIFVNANPQMFQLQGTRGQMMLQSVVLLHCFDRGITALEIDISDWRMRFLGMNRRPKEFKGDDKYWKGLAVKAAAQRNWFCEYHDSAEALGVLDYTLANLDKAYKLKTNPAHGRAQADIIFKRGAHA